MPTDSGTNDILSLGFLHYTTAVSREMSDEPLIGLTAASTAPDFHRDSLLIPFDASIGNLTGAKLMVIF